MTRTDFRVFDDSDLEAYLAIVEEARREAAKGLEAYFEGVRARAGIPREEAEIRLGLARDEALEQEDRERRARTCPGSLLEEWLDGTPI